MWPNPQEIADLVTFTEEILNGKLHFFVQRYADNTTHLLEVEISEKELLAVFEKFSDLPGLQ